MAISNSPTLSIAKPVKIIEKKEENPNYNRQYGRLLVI